MGIVETLVRQFVSTPEPTITLLPQLPHAHSIPTTMAFHHVNVITDTSLVDQLVYTNQLPITIHPPTPQTQLIAH